MPMVTGIYAGALGFMAVWIASRPGFMRTKLDISVGDGGNPELLFAMRRHANFAEWVPIALILIGLLESNGVSKDAIHGLGGGLVVARFLHATGLRGDSIRGAGRALGAGGTALIVLISSGWLIRLGF